MKPGAFRYHDPTTLDELTGLLGSLGSAKLLAGGQSLIPMMNLRLVQPDHLIDLNTVHGLGKLEVSASELQIGSMVRQASLETSHDVAAKMPILTEALQWVGHLQTRSRGTFGGSLSHLDPAAELLVVSLLHDAELTVHGPRGSREVAIADWPADYLTPSLEYDEVLTEVQLPCWPQPHGYAFEEFARRHGDFAIVAVGCLLQVNNGTITRAALAIAGMQAVPRRLSEVEQALVGQPATSDTFRAAAEIAKSQDAISDAYHGEHYRKRLAGVLTERALSKAASRAIQEH